MNKSFVIHPFLFSLFPVLALFSYNIYQTEFSEVLPPLVVILITTIMINLLLIFIFKDSQKIGICISIFLILFLSYGYFCEIISVHIIMGKLIIIAPVYIFVICILFLFIVSYFIIKTQKNLNNITKILNIISFILVLMQMLYIGLYELTELFSYNNNSEEIIEYKNIKNTKDLHDIYYIILDGYARADNLKEFYNFDNHNFIDYLLKKGFYVASKSNSNYISTFMSLPSSLNMEYINYLSDVAGEHSKERILPHNMIKKNKIVKILKSKGYKFIHFNSGYGPTSSNEYADLQLQSGYNNEFSTVLIRSTMLRLGEKYLVQNRFRKTILYTFSELSELHKIKGAKFIFAHIIAPHPPYVFGRNGESTSGKTLRMHGEAWKEKEEYINQLIFVNKKVEVLVDKILSKSDIPPIIILQADHGTASTFPIDTNEEINFPVNPKDELLRERFGILNAYYLPGKKEDCLYDSISPVNTFRLIFNLYFNMNYKLVEDRCFYSSYVLPFKFIDVTDKLK